jgi:hypothetical protein
MKVGGSGIMVCKTDDDRTAVADYICDLTAELALMAAEAEHANLARILEMARLECERACGRRQDEAAESAPDAAGPCESTNVVLLATVRGAQK